MGAPKGAGTRHYVDPMTKRSINRSVYLNGIEDEALSLVARRRSMNVSDTIRALILEAAAQLKKGK
jgi:macrodomain Ter protein organizer (MatP/YcbG family)